MFPNHPGAVVITAFLMLTYNIIFVNNIQFPLGSWENDAVKGNFIIGVDEVGRGPVAGPLYVCAFALPASAKATAGKPTGFPFSKYDSLPPLRDSKKLSEIQRKRWLKYFSHARRRGEVDWVIARVSNKVIDRIGIAVAARRAATRAASGLMRKVGRPGKILLDGSLYISGGRKNVLRGIPTITLTKGDERIPAIACASIVAKERRDAYMRILDRMNPRYGFVAHKGYGTFAHKRALRKYGPAEMHRLTFIRGWVKIGSLKHESIKAIKH